MLNPDFHIAWDYILAGGIGYLLGVCTVVALIVWFLSGFRLWR